MCWYLLRMGFVIPVTCRATVCLIVLTDALANIILFPSQWFLFLRRPLYLFVSLSRVPCLSLMHAALRQCCFCCLSSIFVVHPRLGATHTCGFLHCCGMPVVCYCYCYWYYDISTTTTSTAIPRLTHLLLVNVTAFVRSYHYCR